MSDFNEWSNELRPHDFERMVDGELSLPELRAMISALEENPHQWRQCALAFLEDQAFRMEFLQAPLDDDLAGCLVNRPESTDSSSPKLATGLEASGAETGVPTAFETGSAALGSTLPGSETPGSNAPGTNAEGSTDGADANSATTPSTQKFMNGHRFSKQLLSAMVAAEAKASGAASSDEPASKPAVGLADGHSDSHDVPLVTPKSAAVGESDSNRERQSWRTRMAWVQRIAVAASLLLAFVVGIAGRAWLDSDRSTGLDPSGRTGEIGQAAEADAITPRNDATTLVGGETPNPSGHVRFDIGDETAEGLDANNLSMDVPFYAEDTLPAPTSLGLDSDIKRRLEQSGVQVRSKRQVVSLKTEDGRTVLVPLETLEFVPRQSRRFQ